MIVPVGVVTDIVVSVRAAVTAAGNDNGVVEVVVVVVALFRLVSVLHFYGFFPHLESWQASCSYFF